MINIDYKEYFNSKWPEEGVGYVKDGVFYPLENIAEDKINSFVVDPTFLLNEPDCLLHSHTTGHRVQNHDPRSPSYSDLEFQIKTDIEWGICVTDGENCTDPMYWGNPKRRPELLGRDFIYNLQDCFSLTQDWYYQEYGIALPNKARNAHWNQEGHNYIDELYTDWGFTEINAAKVKRGDLLLYQVRSSVPNHLGIYLGNNQVLSHWYGRKSAVEDYGRWANWIVKRLHLDRTKYQGNHDKDN